MAEPVIRPATPDDADELSAIALRSKAHWGYEPALIDLWSDDLRVNPDDCDGVSVWVLVVDEQIAGFGELLVDHDPAILDDLFLDPAFIGRGLGGHLLEFLIDLARARGANTIEFDAEPNATGFYHRFGAVTIGERASSVVPGRTLPIMRISLASTTIVDE